MYWKTKGYYHLVMVVTSSENMRVSTADEAHAIHTHLFMKVFMHKETCTDN